MCMALAISLGGCEAAVHKNSTKNEKQTKEIVSQEQTTTQEPVTTKEQETETPAVAEKQPDYLFDGIKVNAALDFSEGIGWIKSNDRISAVTSEGYELFSVWGSQIVYASPFSDGTAFVAYKNSAGVFEEAIYNTGGSCLYTTTTSDTATGLLEEHIVAQGEGEYLVMRHEADMRADQWVVGTIDATGNTVCAFQPYAYDNSGKEPYPLKESSLPEWTKSANTGRFSLPMTTQYYSYNNVLGKDAELPWYLGEGIYYLPGQNLLIRPRDGKVMCMGSGHGEALGKAVNGKVLFYHGGIGEFGVADINTGESHYLENIENTGLMGIELPPLETEEGRFFSGHSYYDLDGKKILELTDFADLSIYCSRFYGDYAMAVIEGADKNYYVTVIDRNGHQQFEPFKTERVSADMSEGCFASYADGMWQIYDHNGNSLKVITEGNYYTRAVFSEDIARFIASDGQKLYSLPELGVKSNVTANIGVNDISIGTDAGLSGKKGEAASALLRVENEVFYVNEALFGKTYEEVNKLFDGKLPAMIPWEWGGGYDSELDYIVDGRTFAFFFKDNRLKGLRYEVVAYELGKARIDAYTEAFGSYTDRKGEDGTVIPLGANDSGYRFKTDSGYLDVYYNDYNDVRHVTMHYGV